MPDGQIQGKKYDTGKPRTDLLPSDALLAVAKILSFGAEKYGDRNWEQGMGWGRLYAATLRHLFAWARGEDIDRESGEHHLAHAACDILMLLAYAIRGAGTDDRFKTTTDAPVIKPGEWVKINPESGMEGLVKWKPSRE